MTDNSATAVYHGEGITVSGWRSNALPTSPPHDTDDMTAECDPDAIRLEGETGQTGGFGSRAGDPVPQLNVTKVSTPCKTRGLPSSLPTNPLSSGRCCGR
jgi:hypothetical protein